MKNFLAKFVSDPAGWVAVCVGHPNRSTYYRADQLPDGDPPATDVYFAPAMRSEHSLDKAYTLNSIYGWVDVDHPTRPYVLIAPHMVVSSGGGWHLYWRLRGSIDPATTERVNKSLLSMTQNGDPACFNHNRLLRIPGSRNTKYDPPAKVQLVTDSPGDYEPRDIIALASMQGDIIERIVSGNARGYRSRSERDWAVVTALIQAGVTWQLIDQLFRTNRIGDKLAESNPDYLKRTYEKVLESMRGGVQSIDGVPPKIAAAELGRTKVLEDETGTFIGAKRVATFVFKPKHLLADPLGVVEDAFVGDVTSANYTWPNVTFPRSTFNSLRAFDSVVKIGAWAWLGNDASIRQMLPHYMELLQQAGMPVVQSSPTIGLHFIGPAKDQPVFITKTHTLTTTGMFVDYKGPLAWLPSKKDVPDVTLINEPLTSEDRDVLAALTYVAPPEVIWPMIGWYSAAAFKPWLEKQAYRFPFLNVSGTRGSGKTTLIKRLFLPLFGQPDSHGIDCSTTRFMLLNSLGATNAVPLSLNEYRADTHNYLTQIILQSYDNGRDARGKADQSFVEYLLTAPFSIDGEDYITDPAVQERVVVVRPNDKHTRPGTPFSDTWMRVRSRIPTNFALNYYQWILEQIESGNAKKRLVDARIAIDDTFRNRLPDRVRQNHTVTLFGILCYSEFVGIQPPLPAVLSASLSRVVDMDSGRGRVQADEFVEAIVAEVRQRRSSFTWMVDGRVLFIQMTPAYGWWIAARRRQNKSALELPAIKAQLLEQEYYVSTKVLDGALMYGIDLVKAQSLGLDVVTELNVKKVEVEM